MKKYILFFLFTTLCFSQGIRNAQGVGAGYSDQSMPSSAILEARATNKGFLPPRGTMSNRLSITSPAQGLMFYQTDAPKGLYIYDGSWTKLSNSGLQDLQSVGEQGATATDIDFSFFNTSNTREVLFNSELLNYSTQDGTGRNTTLNADEFYVSSTSNGTVSVSPLGFTYTKSAFKTNLRFVQPTGNGTINFPDAGNATKTLATTDQTHDAVTLAGEAYLSLSGQQITASPVNVAGTNITGVLKAASFPAQTGDVTNTAGSLANTISTGAVTSTKILDGTILNTDINASAGIDATKLIDGSVSNTELGYINTVTSNVQTQLNTNASNIATNTTAIALTASRLIHSSYTTITGVTTPTIAISLPIPASAYGSSDAYEIIVTISKSVTAGSVNYNLYHDTTINGTGNTIASAVQLSATNRSSAYSRILNLNGGIAYNVQASTSTAMTPYVASSGVASTTTYNPAVIQYITLQISGLTVASETSDVTLTIRPLK